MESSKAVSDSGASCSTFCSDLDNAAVSLMKELMMPVPPPVIANVVP